jgi:hypothetical protein
MNEVVALPLGWILGIFGILGSVIATLASILWATVKDRLTVQDGIISKLQDDVDRLSKGCGQQACLWSKR